MKGLIVALDSQFTVKERHLYHPVGLEMVEMLKEEIDCFEVTENDPEEFIESLKSFAQTYHLPGIELVSIQGEERKCGLLNRPHLEALKEAFDKKAAGRIEKIKNELAKPQPDFLAIAREAWERSDDYFVLPSGLLVPEMGLIEYLVNALFEPSPVYISRTFAFER